MNGPEHYAEAERLLAVAHDMRDQAEDDTLRSQRKGVMLARSDFIVARAQAHATLAQAAATMDTALPLRSVGRGAWEKALGNR